MSFIIYRQVAWRNYIISVLGMITPYAFLVCYFIWVEKFNEMSIEFFAFFKAINYPSINFSIIGIISISLLVILLLISMNSFIKHINKSVIKVRKLSFVALWFLFISFVSIIYSGEFFISHLLICIIPISIFFVIYFENTKKVIWSEILFSLLIASIFIERYF